MRSRANLAGQVHCAIQIGYFKAKHLFYDEKTQTLHLKKSKADEDEEAQNRFYEQLPLCDITDVIRFVNEQCRYSLAFTHI